jgi:hypothetical protein
MSAGRRAMNLGMAVACLLLASGCGQPSRGDLHEAAHSLVPEGATVLLEKDAGCVEGARFPSCVDVYFRLEHRSLGERLDLFIANAEEHGWKAERGVTLGGEVVVRLSKGSYDGAAGFWLDRYYRPGRHCDPVSTMHPCAEHFEVKWKGGIIGA